MAGLCDVEKCDAGERDAETATTGGISFFT